VHPFRDLRVPVGKVGVHWFGQNSYAVRGPGGQGIMVDPYFPWLRPPEVYIHSVPPVRESDLPVQNVILTHNHSDHTHPETLIRIAAAHAETLFVGPPESEKEMRRHKLPASRFRTVSAGEAVELGEFAAQFVFSKPPLGDPARGLAAPDCTHLGVVLACGAVRLYFTGDPIHTFAERGDLISAVRALSPEYGFITCHPSEGEFPFFAGAAQLAARTGLRVACPSHYECFVKRTYDPAGFSAAMAAAGIESLVIPYNQTVILG
jgi:L-ascorbate metabolism protein UlaG (beta-lactamase superfamily)